MNILYTVFSFNFGGIEKLLVDILNEWKNEKDNVFLCIINDNYDEELIKKISNKNVKILFLNRSEGGRKIHYIRKYIKIVKENSIDIIHCQCVNSSKFSAICKLINKDIKIVHTVHATNIFSNLKKTDIIFENLMLDKIIAISKAVENEILNSGINSNKVELVYNGIDFSKFNIKNKCIKNKEKINIGCVARIDPKAKGQDILIRAIKEISDTKSNIDCYFAGEVNKNEDYVLIKLKNLANELNVERNIHFLGKIDNISGFLDDIDIFVLPSRYEGFGLALVEAIACKVPVIASNIDGPKEILKNGELGELFEKENYIDLAKKIIELINNENLEKINKSYNEVKKRYSIGLTVDKLRDIYVDSRVKNEKKR
ncbi:TPA: glycosyltransferase [Clostridium perfringens]|nr:glycosyltransferase [Clostridium perfringens]HAT4120714.1 glycosyltransferase [Clostridium perfringens]